MKKNVDSKIYMILWQWSQRRGENLEIPRCPKYNRLDVFSIQDTFIILWHVEAHLLEAFRDTSWSHNWGIKFQPCNKNRLRQVLQVCLCIFHVETLERSSLLINFNVYLYVKKLCIPLLRKTLASKIDLKHDPYAMEPEERDHLELSQCHESNRVDASFWAIFFVLGIFSSNSVYIFSHTCQIGPREKL